MSTRLFSGTADPAPTSPPSSAAPAHTSSADTAPAHASPTDSRVLTTTDMWARMPVILVIILALSAGTIVQGMASGFEWEAIQAPAGPIVCPGGVIHTGYDVSYSVNKKGVSDAATCEKEGSTTPVPPWLMFGLLSVIYAVPFFPLLLWLRIRSRRKLARAGP